MMPYGYAFPSVLKVVRDLRDLSDLKGDDSLKLISIGANKTGLHRLTQPRFYVRWEGLPNYNLLFGGTVHLVALLDAECLEEGGDVAQCHVDTVFTK